MQFEKFKFEEFLSKQDNIISAEIYVLLGKTHSLLNNFLKAERNLAKALKIR